MRRGRGRPSAEEIVYRTLAQMRIEGASLREPCGELAEIVAARNHRTLGQKSWHPTTITSHIIRWLHDNPDENDYRVALTLKEAASESGVKRSLLFVAIGRGALTAHRCGTRTLILTSDFQRFLRQCSALIRPYGKIDLAKKKGPTAEACAAGAKVSTIRRNLRARQLAPIIREIRAKGAETCLAIAAELTRRGIPTATGGRFWQDMPVRNLLERLDRLQQHSRRLPHKGRHSLPE